MLYTTLPVPLTSPLATTLLQTRSPTTASCSIDTATPPLCAYALLFLLLHWVPHVCVNTARFFGRLAIRHHQPQCPYADVMRVSFPWTPHHLTLSALVVSSMLFFIKTHFSNGGMKFRVQSNQHHRSNTTVLYTDRLRYSARVYYAT